MAKPRKKKVVTFTDTEGVVWTLRIHVLAVKKIKDALGLMVTDMVNPKSDLFGQIANDGNPVPLVDMLWVLCSDQAKSVGVDEETFAMSLGEGVLEDALKALLEATVNFSRPSGSKTVMDLYRKSAEINDKNIDLLREAIDLGVVEKMAEKDNPALKELREMVEEARLTSGKKSLDSVESSDSTQIKPTLPLKNSFG